MLGQIVDRCRYGFQFIGLCCCCQRCEYFRLFFLSERSNTSSADLQGRGLLRLFRGGFPTL